MVCTEVAFNPVWRIAGARIPHGMVVRNGGHTVKRGLRDPGKMTSGERLAELGDLLAAAVRRRRANAQKGLAEDAKGERSCASLVNTPKDATNQEVA